MFKRLFLATVISLFLVGQAFAITQAVLVNPDGSNKSKTVTTSLTMNATTTRYSTAEASNGYDRLSFFINYDETEHVGAVKASHLAAAGDGYHVNDIITVTGGTGGDCTLKVLTCTDHAVATYEVLTQGLGYSAGDTQATTVAPEGGTNFTIHITAIGAVLSEAVTLEISPDGVTYQAASFYDYAGGATLQTSETLSADGNYYLWCNRDINAVYTRVKIVSTNSDAVDTIVNTIVAASH